MKPTPAARLENSPWRKALALLLAGLMTLPPATVFAGPPVAAGSTNTTVLPNGSGNGVPVVNIAAPNGAGLSHNKFNSYDVPNQGLILNNSAAAVQTQLGGTILGNPNVAAARANLILNEVVQPNRSLLNGYTEVAGQAAQVIVANPYGITCAGCGFINTPRATLTTGTPNIDANGNLIGFAVRQGDILINGAGLDASGQNYFDLVARSVVIQGQVNAKDLLVAAGRNDMDYAARNVTPVAGVDAAPAYAIDSSALGGMYVDRIRLIATEAGVGVRMLGNVGASVDDITLSAAGRIQLQNQMSAQRDISVAYNGAATAGAIDVGAGAQLYAGRNQSIAAGAGGIQLGTALVGAGGDLSIAGASLADTGAATDYRFANGALSVNVAGTAALGGGNYDAGGALTLSAAGADLGSAVLTGRSAAAGIGVSATAGALNVNGAQINSPGSVLLGSTGDLSIAGAGSVASDAGVSASFGGNFSNAGYLSAAGTMAVNATGAGSVTTGAGSTTLAGTLTVNAPTVTNAGYLQAGTAGFAAGTNLSNSATGTMVLGTAAGSSHTLALAQLTNEGTLYSAGSLAANAAQIDNTGGTIIAGQALTLNATGALNSSGAISAGSATLSGASVNFGGGSAYAAQDLSIAGGTIGLGAASIGAGGSLALTGASLVDTGATANARFSGGALSVNATGATSLGGATYDAGGALGVTGGSVDLGSAVLTGRSAASGVAVSATAGTLDAAGAQITSPGAVALASTGNMTLGSGTSIASNAGVNAGFGGAAFLNSGVIVADGNLQISNTAAAATITNDGGLSSGAAMTLGSSTLGSFTTGSGSSTLANTLTVNAPTVANAGYLQAKSASFAAGANLSNAATGTLVLGTAAGDSNTLALGQLQNSGMLYSAGNLSLSGSQLTNASGGKLVVDGALTASASGTLSNAGNIDVNDATLSAAAIDLSGGTLYAGHDASLTASGTLTMGGSLYAQRDLTVNAGTLADTVTGGVTRAAGRNFSLASPNAILLDNGQVYDAGSLLSVTTPDLRLATATMGVQATSLTSGGDIAVATNSLTLGSTAAAGALQASRDITLTPAGGNLAIQVGAAGGTPRSSLQAGRDILATFDQLTVNDDILANGGITLLTRGPNQRLTANASGWLEAAGTLALRGETVGTRATSLVINPGATVAGGGLALLTSTLTVGDGGLLQGGQGGGTIDTATLNMLGAGSRVIANRWTSGSAPDSYVTIGSAFTNNGLLYAEGNMQVTVTGNIVNTVDGAISSGFGGLALRTDLSNLSTPYQITNDGTIYGAYNLDLLVPEAGTIYNSPTGYIATSGGLARVGQTSATGAGAGTVRNEGVMEFGGDAEITAHNFFNNRPAGAITRSNDNNLSRTYTASGDSGRYDWFLGQEGYDRKHSTVYPAAGAGDHNGRPDWKGSGVNYYHVIDDAYHLYRDYRENWTESDSIASVGAQPQILANGLLKINTYTGQNVGGSISGSVGLQILNIYPGVAGSTFLNQSIDLYTYYLQRYGRTQYDCNLSSGDAACVGTAAAFISASRDVWATWTNGTPHSNWGVNDGVAFEYQSPTLLASYGATLAAPGGQFFSDIGGLSNVTSTTLATPTARTTSPQGAQGANPSNPGSGGNQVGGSTPSSIGGASTGAGAAPGPISSSAPGTLTINGANIRLPTGRNGLFVVSTNPNARYLVESNPLYASADNPYLGSDYLAKLLGFDPDKLELRLGDANYEARLIRDQISAQTGSSLLRTALDSYDQEKQLLDNASLEAKELKLNLGTALTAEQVASLKHDIVWMVEQEVQGKKVLVPVVYLSNATRASLSGATIVAENTVVTGDSFLNRGGSVSGASNLVIVTRQDIVNSSGTLSGGNVQLQSLEGDIINRTETFRSGDAGNYTTSAGRSGGIYASNSLFMKADRDISVQGATVQSAGDATVVAGRNLNVSALVLEARTTNIQNNSGMFNRDVSQTVDTTQTAQGASITAGGNLVLGAKKDVNLTGAYVGATGTATIVSEQGNVNIGTVQLTNTRQENTEHVGFFAESRAGSQPKPQDAAVQSGQATAPPGTQPPTVGGVAGRMGTADSNKTGGDKPQYDPNAHSAEAFTGLAVTTTQASSSATGNLGSTVQGAGVNIVAQKGDVNIQGSNVTSGAQGTLIDAAGNVNITAAYDTASSTRKEQSTRIGVAAEAGPGGAFAGVKTDGSSLDSQRSSSTAVTSTLGSQGSISIRAGGNLLNEGTKIDAAQNVNVMAATVENKAAQNTTSVNERSTQFNASIMGGVTTGGIGESISGMVQGTSKELNVAAPEAQLRAQASGSSTTTVGNTSTAVVTDIKSGGNTNFQVAGRMLDQGTSYSATGSVNIDAGSYENRAAANISNVTTNSTSGGGTLTVGVDASRSANANIAIQGSNSQSSTSSSTAVTGSITGAGGVNIRARTGDVTLEGTRVDAKQQGVNIDAAGNLNLLQANNTSTTNSKTTEGSANLSASLCVDLSCASAGAGASARTTTLNENVREGVAGSLSGGSVNLRSGGNMTLQGTSIQSTGATSLDAGGKVDFQALTSTISSTSTADGGGASLNANVGASGKIASDGGGGGSLSFERGRGTTEGTVRDGGSITAGTLSIRSGGDTRLEGTQVQAGSAALNVGGNLTLESAQSTLKSDQNSVSGSLQASGGKSSDGGRNFGGAISLDVTNKTQDILTNQNATINTTGSTTLNVGGNATLAGANINAQGGVAGDIKGNLTVETRADHEKTEDTSFKGYAGVGNMQIAGKGDGSKPSTANRIDAAQDKIGNVANAAGGTGVFIDYKSDKTDNVTIGQRSGISGGAAGLGGLTVGGNATLIGAQGTQGINVQGTTTSTGGPETRQSTTSDSFTLRGTVASAAGSDQGSGGTFSNLFQASGGQKPGTTADAPDVATRPRSGAVSGEAARPASLGGGATPPADAPNRPRSGAVSGESARPTNLPGSGGASSPAAPTTTRPQVADAPSGASAPGVIPPGRPRSESTGPNTRPADGPTQYGAFAPIPGSTPPAPVTPPGRPRSESTGTDTRPASDGPTQYGAFTPLPGSTTPGPVAASGPSNTPPGRPRSDSVADTPSKPAANSPEYGAFAPVPGSTPPPPIASAPGRPRSESIADTPSKPAANSPEYGAFTPLPGSTTPGPVAASGPSNTPPGRPRSESVADTPSKPAANSPEYGAFAPIPGSAPPAPIASAPGRPRSESIADTPSKPAANSPEYGAFTPLPGSTTPGPVAASGPSNTPPGRPRSDSVADTPSKPAANSPEYGAFAPVPGSTPPAPIASAPGRPRSESVAHAPSKPAANSPEYGAFTPLPGSTTPGPVAASGPSNTPPGRPRSASVADTPSKPAANSPEYGAFTPLPGSTPPGPVAASGPSNTPPGRPRSDSVADTPSKPAANSPEYGAFTPLPGSTTPGPIASAPGRPRSDSVADTPSKPAANSPEYGAFTPLPGSTTPGPVAASGPSNTPPGRPRSDSVADTPSKPAANSPEYGAFTPLPGSTTPGPVAASGPSNTPPGRPRSDSVADTPSKPAANSPEYGAFTPVPGGPSPTTKASEAAKSKPAAQPEVTQIAAIKPSPTAAPAAGQAPIQTRAELMRTLGVGKERPKNPNESGPGIDRRTFVSPETNLKLTTSASKYNGEEARGVKYYTPTERAAHELMVDKATGKLLNASGKPYNTPSDRPDGAIFVIDAHGKIYASGEAEYQKFHHTSLTGNEPVALAGHIVVKDGKLLHINNVSGHYRPDGEQLTGGVNYMKDQLHVDFGDTRVIEMTPRGRLIDLQDGKALTGISSAADAIKQDVDRANGVVGAPIKKEALPSAPPGSASAYGAGAKVPGDAPASKSARKPATNDADGAFPAPSGKSPAQSKPASKAPAANDGYGAFGSMSPASKSAAGR